MLRGAGWSLAMAALHTPLGRQWIHGTVDAMHPRFARDADRTLAHDFAAVALVHAGNADAFLSARAHVALLREWEVSDRVTLDATWLHDVPCLERAGEHGALFGEADRLVRLGHLLDPVEAIEADARTAPIALARRLHAMRRRPADARVAAETRDLFVPLAECMGMCAVRNELGDLALDAIEPRAYARLCAHLTRHAVSLSASLTAVEARARRRFDAPAQRVEARVKAVHSIHEKIGRCGFASVRDVLDVLAVRVVLDTDADCYAGLAWCRDQWPVEVVKDFIATPKANGYRSLHATVRVPPWPVEIQFRTHAMHEDAEHGCASHVLYKAHRSAAWRAVGAFGRSKTSSRVGCGRMG